MIIRGAVAADAGGIASVHVRAWEAAYRTLVPDSYLERLSVEDRTRHWRQTIGRGDPEVWVASEDSEITGWVAFGASRDEGALPGVGEIEALYVDPRHWGTGTGFALWLKARDRLAERGFSTVTLWVLQANARAIRFYQRVGLVPAFGAERTSHRDGRALIELRFEGGLTSTVSH